MNFYSINSKFIYIFFSFFNYIILLFMNVKKGDKLN